MNSEQILTIFSHVCLGLEATHSRNRVHRNISSGHVLLSQEGGVTQLTGHACVTFKVQREKLREKVYLGEYYYLSPEFASGKHPYTFACDIWSLGMLLLEMCVRKKPELDIKGDEFGRPFTLAQIQAKEHHKIPMQYSKLIHDLLEALL